MNTNTSIIAGAIVVAGIIVAGALIMTSNSDSSTNLLASPPADQKTNIRPVDISLDHIRGNPEAPITIVEFSDFECPFCSRFHPTLTKILEEFPDDVRWVYRHFPLTSIHSKANSAAIASECVAKEAGNDAFWEFADSVFSNQNRLGDALYLEIASGLGVSETTFQSCIKDKSIKSLVSEDNQEALDAGARGTPFSVLIAPDGRTLPFSGALPYEQVRDFVEQVLSL